MESSTLFDSHKNITNRRFTTFDFVSLQLVVLTVLEICQPRDLPDVKSQLDLTLFGIEAPSEV